MNSKTLPKSALCIALLLALALTPPARADDEQKPTTLPKSVTLHFEILGPARTLSVTTAKSVYRLGSEETAESETEQAAAESAQGVAVEGEAPNSATEKTSESKVVLEGEVAIDDTTGLVLVTCEGLLHESHQTEVEEGASETEKRTKSSFEFEASTRIKPGESKELVQSGPFSVKLKVEVAE